MKPGATTKLVAMLGVAALLVGSDICLLTCCVSANGPEISRPTEQHACCEGEAAASHHHHRDDGPGGCPGPCSTVAAPAPGPQITPALAAGPLVLPAVLVASLDADEPAETPSFLVGDAHRPSPPRPPRLDASGVRAPPTS